MGKWSSAKSVTAIAIAIIAIFNYYAATSYAAYPEIPVNDGFFAFLREGSIRILCT